MKKVILIISLCLCTAVFAQDPSGEAILGFTGNKAITKRDFEERYEFTPTLYSQSDNSAQGARLNFAYTLLAEKLWALEAEARKLDTSTAIRVATTGFENIFIRDLLYHREIRDKATYTDAELQEAIRRQSIKYYVNYLYSDDSTEIYSLYKLLQNGANFDTILSTREELGFQPKPEEVQYGQLADDVEDALYKLTVFQYTAPLYTPTGWYLFYVKTLTQQITADPTNGQSQTVEAAKRILKARKEQERFRDFFFHYFLGKKAEASAPLMKSLAVHLSNLLTQKKQKEEINDTVAVTLEARDMAEFLHGFSSDSLQKSFITSTDLNVSFRDFLLMFAFDGYRNKKTDLNTIFKDLQTRTRHFIEMTMLAQEGRKRGLEKDPEVTRQVKMWKDNYLYQMMRGLIADSVSVNEADLLFYYNKYHKDYKYPKAVNVIEILTDSLQIVDTILSRVKQGDDFRMLARLYNKRESTKKSDGEYGFFPVDRFGEIGRIAWQMKEGDVFGPITVSDGYAVIKLLGKRSEYVEKKKVSFEEARADLIKEVRGNRIKHKLDVQTAQLAQKYGITIDGNIFRSVETTTIPAFGIRRLGFGGQITAAPLVAPDNDWVNEFEKQTDLHP